MEIRERIKNLTQEFDELFTQEIKNTLYKQKGFYVLSDEIESELESVIIDYSSNGKRIRPFIATYLSNQSLGNIDILNACMALEFFHLSALIHDDIMDNADSRRGSPSIHHYAKKFSKFNINIGRDLAILYGDLFLAKSFEFAANLEKEARELFFEMIKRTIQGQYIDTISSNEEYGILSPEFVLGRHELKTAWYTFVSPALIGITINKKNLDTEIIEEVKKIMLSIGMLYQIRDDIKDCNDENSGKDLFKDIYANQTTWVTLQIKEKYPEQFKIISENRESLSKNDLQELFKGIDLDTLYKKEVAKVEDLIQSCTEKYPELKIKSLAILSLIS